MGEPAAINQRPADHPVPVAIVGGGPIGLEVAAGLATSGVRAVVFEAGCVGDTIAWWAPQTRFFSSPERIALAGVPIPTVGEDKTRREAYLAYLRTIVETFGLDVRTFTRVLHAHPVDGEFALLTSPSDHGVGGPEELARVRRGAQGPGPGAATARWRARHLVLAVGDLHRPRLLGVPGEDLPHVSHWFDDPHLSFHRRILIVGGKNSAVEAALRLHRIGASVTISYRGERFDSARIKPWLRPELEWLIDAGRIRFLPRSAVCSIEAQHVHLKHLDDPAAAEITLEADRVFLLTGYEQDPELFVQLGVALTGDQQAPAHDPGTMETNVPGVFVAGTAVAGTQSRARVFIENSHVHAERIVRRLTGVDLHWESGAATERFSRLAES